MPATAHPSTHYSTTITTVYGSQYPIAGHLDLELSSSGTLRGYYHNAYQKAFIQVVGGRDGNYIWFDIGPSQIDIGLGIGTGERLHIVATMNGDGSFRGQAFPQIDPGRRLCDDVAGQPGGVPRSVHLCRDAGRKESRRLCRDKAPKARSS